MVIILDNYKNIPQNRPLRCEIRPNQNGGSATAYKTGHWHIFLLYAQHFQPFWEDIVTDYQREDLKRLQERKLKTSQTGSLTDPFIPHKRVFKLKDSKSPLTKKTHFHILCLSIIIIVLVLFYSVWNELYVML